METEDKRSRRWPLWLAALLFAVSAGAGWALLSPASPLPGYWNPLRPLVILDPVTPVTAWKLRKTAADPELCHAALNGAVVFEALEPKRDSAECGISHRVQLSGLPASDIAGIETSCAIALRTAMWETHGLQPAARELLGSPVSTVRQIGSYNCRRMRTGAGSSTRMSTHATAEAIDITGFSLADGRLISLISDWDTETPEAKFLRAARTSACQWFVTVLSPDYNALHADHFHLQSKGWGTCR